MLLTFCLFGDMALLCSAVQLTFQRQVRDTAPPPPADPLSGQQSLLVRIQFKCFSRVNEAHISFWSVASPIQLFSHSKSR